MSSSLTFTVALTDPAPASGAVKAAVATMSVAIGGSLLGPPYEGGYHFAAANVSSWSGVATNNAPVDGKTGNTGTNGNLVAKCPGQTAPPLLDGETVTLVRGRYGLNKDLYGVGDYLDLRYFSAIVTGRVETGGATDPYVAPAAIVSGAAEMPTRGWSPAFGWGTTFGAGTPSVSPPGGFSVTGTGYISEQMLFGGSKSHSLLVSVSFSIS